jgi:hypothetical protein
MNRAYPYETQWNTKEENKKQIWGEKKVQQNGNIKSFSISNISNINEINDLIKRCKVVGKNGISIYFLKETNFRFNDILVHKIRNIFHANGKQKKTKLNTFISDKTNSK